MSNFDNGARSYDDVADIGELYDHVGIYVGRRDVSFYVDVARECGGPVLEVGCGTGRILIPTARAGVSIAGLDRSSAMLARCREKVSREPKEIRDRVDLHAADMRSFDIGRQFALVTAPFRGMQHLVEESDQRAFLACAHRHLIPGGRLVFDVFNPDPKKLATPVTEEQEDTPRTMLPGQRSFRRAARLTAIDRVAQVSRVELVYYVADSSGREERRVQAFPMRWYFVEELERLLALSGFVVRAWYGDQDRSQLTHASPDIIVIAERT